MSTSLEIPLVPAPLPPQPLDPITDVLPAHQVSVMAGASGAGKSTLIAQVLKDMQLGKTATFTFPCRPDLEVGYITADRTLLAFTKLATIVGLDLARLPYLSLIDDTTISLAQIEHDPLALLLSLLQRPRFIRCDLIIVDPLIAFLGVNLNAYHLVAPRLIRLARYCSERGLTILGTHHATKARSDFSFMRPQDRISGSSALLGFTSTHLFLDTPEESGKPHTHWHVVSHHAPPKMIELARDATGLFLPIAAKSPAIDDLVQALPGDGSPISRKALVATLPEVAPRTLDRWLLQLTAGGVAIKLEHGAYALAVH